MSKVVILNSGKVLMDIYFNFCVVFALKKTNTVAYVLAARGLLIDGSQTYHLTPFYIAETIINEMLWVYFCQKKYQLVFDLHTIVYTWFTI